MIEDRRIEFKVNMGGRGLPDITESMMIEAQGMSRNETEYFDNLERIQRRGLKRYFIAQCKQCEGMKLPFEDQDKRNDWAREHSKAPRPEGFPKCVVKVYDEWVPA